MSVNHHPINRYNVHHYPVVPADIQPIRGFAPPNVHQYKLPQYSYSPTEQLRVRIHENHLSYLSRDDTPHKYELRGKIESLINEYLSLVHHSHKFSFAEINNCLTATVKKPDFDPHKTIAAFEAIERYATNLLNHPWRHEFRTIFAYSGFFYRMVDRVLVGYRSILELIGFAFDESSNSYKLTEIPIDPDRLSQVSLECLVAIVECQTMVDIKTLIKNRLSDITWSDIHSVRCDYICNTEQAIKLLSDLKKTAKLIDIDVPDYGIKNFTKIDLLSPISHNSIVNNVRPSPSTRSYLESNLDNLDSIEFIDSSNTGTPVRHRAIESRRDLPSSSGITRGGTLPRSTSDITEQLPKLIIAQDKRQPTMEVDISPTDSEGVDLNSALLSEINQFETNHKPQFTNNFNSLPKSERKIKIKINDLKGYKDGRFDTLISPTVGRQVKSSPSGSTSGLHSSNSMSSGYSTPTSPPKLASNFWSCRYCTYLNAIAADVCEMCHRSRFLRSDSSPLVSGGRVCSLCTLVNGKDDKNCKACSTSLADSPTYI